MELQTRTYQHLDLSHCKTHYQNICPTLLVETLNKSTIKPFHSTALSTGDQHAPGHAH